MLSTESSKEEEEELTRQVNPAKMDHEGHDLDCKEYKVDCQVATLHVAFDVEQRGANEHKTNYPL
jgi:hypothetical protein